MSTDNLASPTMATVLVQLNSQHGQAELCDERFVQLRVRELFGQSSNDGEGDNALGFVWAYFFTKREQIAFLDCSCVRKGVCARAQFV